MTTSFHIPKYSNPNPDPSTYTLTPMPIYLILTLTPTLTLTVSPELFSMHSVLINYNNLPNPNPNPNYCPPRIAMFGVQCGEGAVHLASARSGTQGGSLTHPHCGTSFFLSRVCLYLHAKLVPNAAQTLLTFAWHSAAFSPTYAHAWRRWSQGGNIPSRTGRPRGVSPPRTTAYFLCARQYAHAKLV